jgi:hypothetical protein
MNAAENISRFSTVQQWYFDAEQREQQSELARREEAETLADFHRINLSSAQYEERAFMVRCLRETQTVEGAARLSCISRTNFFAKLEQYEIGDTEWKKHGPYRRMFWHSPNPPKIVTL